jgi:hypothetical protein
MKKLATVLQKFYRDDTGQDVMEVCDHCRVCGDGDRILAAHDPTISVLRNANSRLQGFVNQ